MAKQKRLDLILGARDRASGTIGRVTGSIGGLAMKVAALAGTAISAAAIVSFGKRSVAAFQEQEAAVEALRTALGRAGDDSAAGMQGMLDFASGLQAITTQGDEATLKLAAYISTIGELSGEALQNATTATLGLAAATGQGQEIMGRAYLNALQGNFSMLERYVPALRAATTEQEKMALVMDLASKGFDQMTTEAQTSAGQIQQMRNTVGDFMELIGARLAPILAGLATRVKGFVDQNGAMIAGFVGRLIEGVQAIVSAVVPRLRALGAIIADWIKRYTDFILPWSIAWAGFVRTLITTIVDVVSSGFSAIMGLIQPLMGSVGGIGTTLERVRDVAIRALLTVQFGFQNWRAVVELAAFSVMHAVVRLGNQVSYVFTEVLPSVLTWLADNWRSVLTDLGNASKAFFTNLVSSAVETITRLPELLSGDVSIGEIWGKSMLEGFEATLTELPKIAERQEGELERTLREQMEESQDGLGDGLDTFMRERLAEMERQRNTIKDFFKLDLGVGDAPEPIDPQQLLAPGGVTVPVKVEEDGSVSIDEPGVAGGARERRGVAAVEITRQFLGVAGAFSGQQGAPELETAANTKKAADEAAKQSGYLKRLVEKVEAARESSGGIALNMGRA
jgi:hypothetical protein